MKTSATESHEHKHILVVSIRCTYIEKLARKITKNAFLLRVTSVAKRKCDL